MISTQRHERTSRRTDCRNGKHSKVAATTTEEMSLTIPKLRTGLFFLVLAVGSQGPRGSIPGWPDTTTATSTCPSPTASDSSTRAPTFPPKVVGSSYDNAAAQTPGKPL